VRRIVYWEKWAGFEGAAMDRVVDLFNQRERERRAREPSYRPIEVERVTISSIEQKLLVAIAGKNPPDVAGSYGYLVAAYADKGALTDLTPRLADAGIQRSDYIGRYFDLGVHRGKVWALPATPASVALHWNKRLFRDAGLDPERPPRTIEELDEFAERLTVWEVTEPDGARRVVRGYASDVPANRKRLLQVGFLHTNPPWWSYVWGSFFGGKLAEGERITTDAPENVRAYEWIEARSKKLGVEAAQRFESGLGKFGSPQNPFLSGRIAMQLQGVWMHNYIEKYAPGLQWGVAAFPHPADRPDLANGTLIEVDTLVIPRDSKHPDEAFEFIRFVNTPEIMEVLCLGQRKFPPLERVSDEFWKSHPHPEIRLFRELAMSPNAFSTPKVSNWNEYLREIRTAVDSIDNLNADVPAALREVRRRIQLSYDREQRSIDLRSAL
jgi:multiple sugar transport system substrate-binding protein